VPGVPAEGTPYDPNLEGERVALGPLRRELVPTYQRWINDFGTARTLAVVPRPLTEAQEIAWFERAANAEDGASFTVYERADARAIGIAGLYGIAESRRAAMFTILIGEAAERGKGLGTDATRLVLDYAFSVFGLERVTLTVAEFNIAARRAYGKAGFTEIGRRRAARWMGGRRWDMVVMECRASARVATDGACA